MGHAYETIVAWQKAGDLTVEIYRVTDQFPTSEMYGLTSQMRRAAVSVPANIAEGAARQYMNEYQHYLYVAKSSLPELAYYIHLTCRLRLISEATRSRLDGLRSDTGRPLQGLIAWVEQQSARGVVLNKRISDASEFYATCRELSTDNSQRPTDN